ncbi:beta-galactoside alpha-2,6-sialyltransferase 1 isoform X2 [Eurosta solidaginis]|uniref:beta-galactoside alpha-2,6-sialyltransferase 1 isoform X2 n=1 Tax=Eurosta solidaginis TaxID=178769 RepID=UPI003530F311
MTTSQMFVSIIIALVTYSMPIGFGQIDAQYNQLIRISTLPSAATIANLSVGTKQILRKTFKQVQRTNDKACESSTYCTSKSNHHIKSWNSFAIRQIQRAAIAKYNCECQHRKRRSVFHIRWNPAEKIVTESHEKPAVNCSKLSPHPRLKLSKNTKLTFNPKLFLCHDKHLENCQNKTANFRQHPVFANSFEEQYYPSSCLVMDAGVKVLRRKDPPFRKGIGKLFPKQNLFRKTKDIETCAIVSSAGSISGSKLGRFIDTHDIVMRFNHAPTQGYEVDVGSKTTIRVLNSQVVTKTHFNFTHAPLFQNITIAAWDSGKYNSSLSDWLTTADYDLFTNYEIYRRNYPKSRAFLVDPHSVWRLWQSLQTFIGNRPIRKNPPSSGFIGLALLLPFCPVINFIEYIPSTRLNGRCHYYSKEINSACTFGAWHPLAAEKLMALDMNLADDMSVFQHGIMRIRRPDKLLCRFNFFGY